jgi:hypothetical protein
LLSRILKKVGNKIANYRECWVILIEFLFMREKLVQTLCIFSILRGYLYYRNK